MATERHGTAGDDRIDVRGGEYVIYGHAGDDQIRASEGQFTIYGGEGNDTIQTATTANVVLYGDADDDNLSTSLGTGDNTLIGGAGNDYLAAGPGDDLLIGGAGNDLLAGGFGADRFVFEWTEQVTGAVTLFRNGQHPNPNGNAKAWEQYDRQAAERGFTHAVGTIDGHTLWGRMEGGSVTYVNQSGVDVIGGFNYAQGDRIDLQGISDLGAFTAQVVAVPSAQFGALAWDLQIGGQTFLTVYPEVNGTPYSSDWFI